MSRGDWERRLPDGVRVESRDRSGFRLGVVVPVGEDGLWPMRCPEHPEDHFFKIEVTQKSGNDEDSGPETEDLPLYCPYCGHGADLWDFAPEQHARLMAAANAAAEQYMSSMLDEMLGKAFGGRSRSSSRGSGISIGFEFKPGNPPRRRTLPEPGEVEETRRTMQCRACEEVVAVYGLAIYCPNCGQLAPAEQFGELVRMHRDGLAALDALPQEVKRELTESGALGANYENTIKDGFGALETFLRARFAAGAPDVSLQGKGNVFQRLGDAADLYREHLGVDLPALLGTVRATSRQSASERTSATAGTTSTRPPRCGTSSCTTRELWTSDFSTGYLIGLSRRDSASRSRSPTPSGSSLCSNMRPLLLLS